MEGHRCPLVAFGHYRDGKRGKTRIEYGLLTDAQSRPVAIRTFPGNTGDPTAFVAAVAAVRDTFGLARMTMIGDRGMLTAARIAALAADSDRDWSWITCLRAGDIAALAAAGLFQPSLFDTGDLAEIGHPHYRGERLIACRNPALADQRARTRSQLLSATETLMDAVATRVRAGRLHGANAIGIAVGKVIGRHKMAKHLTVTITDDALTYTRNQTGIDAEAALDDIYVIRTNLPTKRFGPAAAVTAYNGLTTLERDWRNIKTDDLDLRPIHHDLSGRVEAHLLICM